ncbi:hypothetical protein BN2475_190085 [Paraburkholderia ribeironis]|uniref:Uncharacterized protein n=1 Tax=Paraburkholderia ribeironis TaxID=1247936 RepID=A0A1N7RVJ8_9BURK|nr:hypothetical protein BN2475_190085 [Paraburkholderia ribeironis]
MARVSEFYRIARAGWRIVRHLVPQRAFTLAEPGAAGNFLRYLMCILIPSGPAARPR